MSSTHPSRSLFTVLMNLLVVVAVILTIRVVVRFFGALGSQGWGEAFTAITNVLVIPMGIDPIKTPYGGVFDVAAAATVVLLLVAEWVLGVLRSRA